MGFPKFEIELDNPSKAYFPGQNISGRVVLISKKDSKIEGLLVEFLGRASVRWSENVTETIGSGKEKKTVKRKVDCNSEEVYFNCKIFLLGSVTIPTGQSVHPFSFILPNGLPSSFVGSAGQVLYLLNVKIKQNKKEYEKKVLFTVNGILDLNIEPGADQIIEQRKAKNLCCLCCRNGPISFVLRLPRKGFVPGELLFFTVEMDNKSRRKVKGTKIILIQKSSFLANDKTFVDSRIIRKITGPIIERGESEMWIGDTFEIPAIPPTRLANCQIINVQYTLQFVMELPGAVNLRCEVPIIIGTIPFRNTFNQFTSNSTGTSFLEAQPGPSSEMEYIPSAPILEGYPDLPPPSYAEAMMYEQFNPNGNSPSNYLQQTQFPNEKEFGITNRGLDEPENVPIETQYMPSYIMFQRRKV